MIGEGVRVEKNPSETRKVGQAAVTYTPNLNHTSVGVMMEEVYRRGEVTTNLEFSFGFEGREPARPKQVSWAFLADWNLFRSGAPLVVEVDGRRFSFRPERDMSMPGQHVGQMDFATFERVANSKRARLSVGRVAFILSESQREALRDMLKALETPAK
ncbi:MAG TPA: hypothetical protein VFZ44_16370 [Pyrinomonadaceae bacterium]